MNYCIFPCLVWIYWYSYICTILLQVSFEGCDLVFYLEDNNSAVNSLTKLSRRISIGNGKSLYITAARALPPNTPLTEDQKEALLTILSSRYCVELKRLDLKYFHNDSKI